MEVIWDKMDGIQDISPRTREGQDKFRRMRELLIDRSRAAMAESEAMSTCGKDNIEISDHDEALRDGRGRRTPRYDV